MNFTSQMRYNPETGEYEKYYRLKESYRNASGRACTRILLNVGFIHGLRPEEIRDISCGLTYKCAHGVCPPVHSLWMALARVLSVAAFAESVLRRYPIPPAKVGHISNG